MSMPWVKLKKKFRAVLLMACLGLLVQTGFAQTNAPSTAFPEVATQIGNEFAKALELSRQGSVGEAQSIISDAYFELFEASGMETAVGLQSPGLKSDLESQFNRVRGSIAARVAPEEIEKQMKNLQAQIQGTAFQLSRTQSRWEIMLSSLTIILREGFEAILIIGAIVAFLLKTNNRQYLSLVRSSVWTGLGASAVVAAIFTFLLKVSPAQQELIEGLTMLLACGVLFMVGHWLVAKAESDHWQNFLRTNLQNSLTAGSRRAIWFTCFLAVFREGAETVLFYQALWASAPQSSSYLLMGLAAGSALLAVIYFTFKAGILRIPMKPFFRATSTLLYYLAFVFAGRAVIELQAGGYLLVHELKGWPTISFLGLYPTLQSVALQAVFILALIGSLAWISIQKKLATRQIA